MLIQKWQDSIKAKREKYLASKPRPAKVENYDDDPQFKAYLTKLTALREDGVIKLSALEDEIAAIKINKQISKEDKEKLLYQLGNEVLKAKIVIAEDQYKMKKVVSYKIAIAKNKYKHSCAIVARSKDTEKAKNARLAKLEAEYVEEVQKAKAILATVKKNNKKLAVQKQYLAEQYKKRKDQVLEAIDKKYQELIHSFNKKKYEMFQKHKAALNKIKSSESKTMENDIAVEKQSFKERRGALLAARKAALVELKKEKTEALAKLDKQHQEDVEKATNRIIGERHKIDKLVKEALALSEERYEKEYESILASNEIKSFKIKADGKAALMAAKEAHIKNMSRIKTCSFKNKQEMNAELENEKNTYAAAKTAIITDTNNKLTELKQENYAAYQAKYYYNWAVRNHVHSFKEKWGGRWQHFKVNFDFTQWITKYALYIIIVVVFAVLAIVSATTQHVNILSGSAILNCLQQVSPKIFFSLGAACLILLGGTDLSIGRLTGIGVSFTLMILSSSSYADNYGNVWFHTAGMAGAGRVIIALLVSVGFCTLFSAFSGFFSAKFKVHPFITTLATQLISYGIFQIFWSATSSFSGTEKDLGLFNALRGAQSWQLILYAVIAIAIVWFIWNKTKFGKNLYAVGGNQEAAKVSGINPFVITLLAFVMAGVLYGLGGFVQALQVGTGNFNTGYGTETDAIAACVIGGISFTGGIGKVSGAVIGTIVLGFLTFAFSSMGMGTNLQLVIKGLIIIVAVTLDCVKYIKRK